MTTTTDLYRQAVTIYRSKPDLSPEDAVALETAYRAYRSAREAQEVAYRSRKDRDARTASADAMVEVAQTALAAAQVPEAEAEADRYRRAEAVIEQVYGDVARDVFGTTAIRYVNSVPTGQKVSDYYGEHEVYRTTVDDEPVPLFVRAFEVDDLDMRVTIKRGSPVDLSLTVSLLSDDDRTPEGVRKDWFGYEVSVNVDRGRVVRMGGSSIGGSSIAEAEDKLRVLTAGVRAARIIEGIIAKGEVA